MPAQGTVIHLDLARTPEAVIVNNASVKDSLSDAVFSLKMERDKLEVSFAGNLSQKTVNAFVDTGLNDEGWISGKLKASVP